MNALEKTQERYYSRQHNTHRLTTEEVLAYLQLHYDGGMTHPDDRMDPENGLSGWHMLLTEKMVNMGSHDMLIYPSWLMPYKQALDMLESFHADDEEGTMSGHVEIIKDWLSNMTTEGIKDTLRSHKELTQFHNNDWPADISTAMDDALFILRKLYDMP